MKNILKHSDFGDVFVTEGKQRVVVMQNLSDLAVVRLVTEGGVSYFADYDGKSVSGGVAVLFDKTSSLNVVSKYVKPIDEKKLNKLACEFVENIPHKDLEENVRIECPDQIFQYVYKGGFRAAQNL